MWLRWPRILLVVFAATVLAGLVVVAVRPGGHPTADRVLPPTPSSTALSVSPSGPPAADPDPSAAAFAAALGPLAAATPNGCIAVWRGERPVFEVAADVPVMAASVTKLFTAVAAIDVLGAETRLRTTVTAGAAPADGVLDGDLGLVGGGDPVLGTARWAAGRDEADVFTPLEQLADRVTAAGVRRVRGRVVGDEGRYDDRRDVATWPRRFLTDGEVGPLSALTVNDGFRVLGHPGIRFNDPPAGAAAVFADLLRARGVAIDGDPVGGVAPAGMVLATIDSAPVGELVAEMLRESDNGTAELLVKEIGFRHSRAGSTSAGVDAIADTLRRRRLPLTDSVLADGSGLSSVSRVTCRLVAAALTQAQGILAPRLSVAGRTGTLKNRLIGTVGEGRVRAKTGSVDGVAAIAGYIDGTDLSFAYVANDLPAKAPTRQRQDTFILGLLALA